MVTKAWNIWKSTPFDWWQSQLNFTLWRATAGCGVSFEGNFQAKDSLLASLYWFDVYYTRCFFTHSFKLLLSDGSGDGAGAGTLPLLPVNASTRVEIAIQTAVRMDAILIPYSRKWVRMRSASVVSSWRIRLNVSQILLIWARSAAVLAERASILDFLSIIMSESSRSRFLI